MTLYLNKKDEKMLEPKSNVYPTVFKLIAFVTLVCFCAILAIEVARKLNAKTDAPKEKVEFFNKESHLSSPRQRNLFDCRTIQKIKIGRELGHGTYKTAYLGNYNGMLVAVKVGRQVSDVVKEDSKFRMRLATCIDDVCKSEDNVKEAASKVSCLDFPAVKFMREILLLPQLGHPGFVRLLGYCMKSASISKNKDYVTRNKLVAVYELGKPIDIESLAWQQRLQYATELADFLHYLARSPMGSLAISEFKARNFVDVDGHIKIVGVDELQKMQTVCTKNGNQTASCKYGLPCKDGLCIGLNEKQNMELANKVFFKKFLDPAAFPLHMAPPLKDISTLLNTTALSANSLKFRLTNLK